MPAIVNLGNAKCSKCLLIGEYFEYTLILHIGTLLPIIFVVDEDIYCLLMK